MDTGLMQDVEFTPKPDRFVPVGSDDPLPSAAREWKLAVPKNLWLFAALQHKPSIYAGTVSRSTIRKRRTQNRIARKSRRLNRRH